MEGLFFALGTLFAGLTTLAVAWMQRKTAERTWLRDQQVIAYRSALAVVDDLLAAVMDVTKDHHHVAFQVQQKISPLFWAVAISGSADTQDTARACIRAVLLPIPHDNRLAQINAAISPILDCRLAFAQAVGRELRLVGSHWWNSPELPKEITSGHPWPEAGEPPTPAQTDNDPVPPPSR